MRQRQTVFKIFLLALVLRLIPVCLSARLPLGLDDMIQYDGLARSIVAGHGYRWYAEPELAQIEKLLDIERPADYDPRGFLTSFRAPGYPAFLAMVYLVSGVGPTRVFAARLANAFLGAALAPLTWLLARSLGLDEKVSRWAGVVIATFPLFLLYPLGLASENLFIPLMTLGLVMVSRTRTNGGAHPHALTGLVLGLTALTRSIVAGFVPIVALWLYWRARAGGKRVALRNGAILILTFLLVTVPWAIRNTRLHGRPTWIETSLGYNLYLGYHPESSGTFQYGISTDLLSILDDAEQNAHGIAAAVRFARDDPGRVPYLMIRKAGHLWALDSRLLFYFYSNNFVGRLPAWLLGAIVLLICVPLILLAPAAAVGLACGRFGRGQVLIGLLLLYYTGVHALIMAEARFHLPLLPIVAILAAYAFVRRPWREAHTWQRWMALILVALLALNWGLELARDWATWIALFGPEGHRLNLPY
ncbi:MAG TPA: hypothetical protein ENN19_11215 [Chloroflexi bacterium]|nr:hypothetical protein [Chloroflexota bacterium]